MEPDSTAQSTPASVTYKQLGVLALAFTLGAIVALLVYNVGKAAPTTFSTTQLIGFVLTVILSGASIVLAISAIALGKSSEQAVIRRSDESIRLQNEVFVRTTEALQRIEASTGVTEKRIEDIISGRVGDISHKIAELATEEQKGKPRSFAELQEQIRDSLLETLRTERDATERELGRERFNKRRREREERAEQYDASHKVVMRAMCNLDDLKVEKSEHGHSDAAGEELFDGLFRGTDYRVGVSTYIQGTPPSTIRGYLANAIVEIKKNTVDVVLALLFVSQHADDELIEVDAFVSQLEESQAKRILVMAITPEESTEAISKIHFSNNEIYRTQ